MKPDVFDTGPSPFLVDEEETCRCGHYIEDHARGNGQMTACNQWDCLCPYFIEGDYDEL